MTGVPAGPRPPAYLDHAATTPLRPEARAAMLPWIGGGFGNPSGDHAVARAARQAIDEARDTVAALLGCAPNEVVFTSGGTEADNLAVRGVAAARPGPVLCSAVEHHAVLHPVEHVGGKTVPVDGGGRLDLDALAEALEAHPGTTLVSVMGANNEVGVVQPVVAAARLVRKRAPGAAFHCDAVQAAAWLDPAELTAGADLVSISAHKCGGPQGVGVLVVRRGTPLQAQALGGGQERELRSGTHNVAGIVGLAAALAAKAEHRADEAARVGALRDRLAAGLLAAIPAARETAVDSGGDGAGDRQHVLPGTLHLTIPGVESEALLFLLDEARVCASAASACASGAQEASHVLAAMGVPPDPRLGALRLSLGWTSTDAEIDRVLDVLPPVVDRLRRAAGTAAGTSAGSSS
ncbi:MAG TPA: cysteine desulfurase family protein [Acidimicrobiales bacterium]|jgi:cysteine desulfurase|nr:cysteine desulfurase family protein [Acidimicrobiales bacterium]